MADAVARTTRASQLRNVLKLEQITPEQLAAEIEAFASQDWRPRVEIVSHARAWLSARDENWVAGGPDLLSGQTSSGSTAVCFGARATPDGRKRTDIYHRRARSLLPDLPQSDFAESLASLVRVHLGSYGPAQRLDLAFFFGTGLGAVDEALQHLGQKIIHLRGPNDETISTSRRLPSDGVVDPGLRLLRVRRLLVVITAASRS
jgi:hypothetical protein